MFAFIIALTSWLSPWLPIKTRSLVRAEVLIAYFLNKIAGGHLEKCSQPAAAATEAQEKRWL